jgi:hypothetical protein
MRVVEGDGDTPLQFEPRARWCAGRGGRPDKHKTLRMPVAGKLTLARLLVWGRREPGACASTLNPTEGMQTP